MPRFKSQPSFDLCTAKWSAQKKTFSFPRWLAFPKVAAVEEEDGGERVWLFPFLTNGNSLNLKQSSVALTCVLGGDTRCFHEPARSYRGAVRESRQWSMRYRFRGHTTPRSAEEGSLEEGPYLFTMWQVPRALKLTVSSFLILPVLQKAFLLLKPAILEEAAAKGREAPASL